jgi:hypothetical protein
VATCEPPYRSGSPDPVRSVGHRRNVAYWHLADIPTAAAFVRYWTKAEKGGFRPGTVCLLLTQSGHSAASTSQPLSTLQMGKLSRYDGLL